VRVLNSYLGGQWTGSGDAHGWFVNNPANLNCHVARATSAGDETAKRAVEAAEQAFPRLNRSTPAERVGWTRRLVDNIRAAESGFADIITAETGKTLTESLAEVRATLRDAEYQIALTERGGTREPPATSDGTRAEIRYEPLGVILAITPWNFPLATILRKMIPALLAGNAVVIKPSPLTPFTAARLFDVLDHCGLPPGAANLVLDASLAVAEQLVADPRIRAITFTGSTRTGLELERQLIGRQVRLQAEMGGKNAMVVFSDANVDAALEHAVVGAFACAGQWCMGTSRLILEQPIYERFLSRLAERTAAIRIGDGTRPSTNMGPVASAAQLDRFVSATAQAQEDGARLVVGGHARETVDGQRGYYVEPTIFADVTPAMALAREEVFVPVLAVLRARDADEAIHLANATDYGLTCSIYTGDGALSERFVREIDCGICHVNLPTYHRDVAMPLSAWKASGRGLPECGRTAFEFFTRPRVVYTGAPS
jgi:aldehyde dehydrogenase (NAD+)